MEKWELEAAFMDVHAKVWLSVNEIPGCFDQ